jgi:hypothetical protein
MGMDSIPLPQNNNPQEIQKMGLDLLEKVKTIASSPSSSATDWQPYTPTIIGTVSNPTPNAGAVFEGYWRRQGPDMKCRIHFYQASAGLIGSGSYYFTLPSSYTIDFTKLDDANTGNIYSIVGIGEAYYGGTPQIEQALVQAVKSVSSSAVTLAVANVSGANLQYALAFVGSTLFQMNIATLGFDFVFEVPIVGWGT